MQRRHFAFLTGAMLTAPAHQWLVHDPGPLVSGLAGRRVSMELAELGQLCGWCGYDAGQPALAQRYYIAGLRAAHSADDRPLGGTFSGRWPIRPRVRASPQRL